MSTVAGMLLLQREADRASSAYRAALRVAMQPMFAHVHWRLWLLAHAAQTHFQLAWNGR